MDLMLSVRFLVLKVKNIHSYQFYTRRTGTNAGVCAPINVTPFWMVGDIRLQGLLVGVKAPLLSQPVAFDWSGTSGTTASIRPLFLKPAQRSESSPSINGFRHERWERSFPATAPSFKPFRTYESAPHVHPHRHFRPSDGPNRCECRGCLSE